MTFRGLSFPPLKSHLDEPTFFNLDEKPSLVKLGLKERAEFWNYVTESNKVS